MSALSARFALATSLRVAPSPDARARPRALVIECAHKKGTGSTKNGRDSNPKYLGVKKFGEERVETGNIIVRQVGNKVRARARSWAVEARERFGRGAAGFSTRASRGRSERGDGMTRSVARVRMV